MSSELRILLIDDHAVVRQGLAMMINSEPDFEVVGEAKNGIEALEFLETESVDLIVSDLDMPEMNGLELAKKLKGEPVELILLTMHDNETLFRAALDHGALGFLLKDEMVETIHRGIRAVAGGELFVSPSMAKFLLPETKPTQSEPDGGLASLTPAEQKVLQLVAESLPSKQIADRLNLSYHTVTTHRRNIAAKLGLTGKLPLLNYALEHREKIDALPNAR